MGRKENLEFQAKLEQKDWQVEVERKVRLLFYQMFEITVLHYSDENMTYCYYPPLPHRRPLGDRGLMGPAGTKPEMSRQIKKDMKGTKGERGSVGGRGFTGPRGL